RLLCRQGPPAARLPEHVPADLEVGYPPQDEQQVRETVEVLGGERVDSTHARVAALGSRLAAVRLQRRPGGALGATGHRAGHMQVCRAGSAAREDEGAQLLQLVVEAVAVGLELVDPDVLDAQRWVVVAGRERGAQVS